MILLNLKVRWEKESFYPRSGCRFLSRIFFLPWNGQNINSRTIRGRLECCEWARFPQRWRQDILMKGGDLQFSSVQLPSHVWLFATPWIATRQASLSITSSRSSLKLMSIESVMPSSNLILCHPLLLLSPTPPSIRVFSNESTLCMKWPKYWSFSFSIIPSKEHPGPISFRMDWLDLLVVQGTLQPQLKGRIGPGNLEWDPVVNRSSPSGNGVQQIWLWHVRRKHVLRNDNALSQGALWKTTMTITCNDWKEKEDF